MIRNDKRSAAKVKRRKFVKSSIVEQQNVSFLRMACVGCVFGFIPLSLPEYSDTFFVLLVMVMVFVLVVLLLLEMRTPYLNMLG